MCTSIHCTLNTEHLNIFEHHVCRIKTSLVLFEKECSWLFLQKGETASCTIQCSDYFSHHKPSRSKVTAFLHYHWFSPGNRCKLSVSSRSVHDVLNLTLYLQLLLIIGHVWHDVTGPKYITYIQIALWQRFNVNPIIVLCSSLLNKTPILPWPRT